MSEQAAEKVLANIRDALQKMAEASRVIITHPANEAGVRTTVARSPFAGLLDVIVSDACPTDRVFLIPTSVIPPETEDEPS